MRIWGSPPANRWLLRGWVLGLTLAVAAPVLRRGYVLSYDMVSVPRQSLLPDSLGLGESLPRAVPAEVVVVALSHAVEGQWIQKALLVVLLLTAGLGAAALVPTDRILIAAVAATAYVWNPYVAERLVLGHWWLLLGYGCLPWLVLWTTRMASGRRGALPALVLVAAAGSMVPTAGLLSSLVVVTVLIACLDWSDRMRAAQRLGLVLGALVAVQAVWWLPGLLHETASTGGAGPFAARSEGAGGVLVSLLGLGGIWNADVVPNSRTTPMVVLSAGLVVLGVAYGWPFLRARLGGRLTYALLGLGAGGLLLSAWTSSALGGAVLERSATLFAGAEVFRDAQKFVALWALPVALLVALAAERLGGAVRDLSGRRALMAAAVLLPLVVLPDLAWGVAGRLQPVALPTSWAAARQTVAQSAAPGDVLVLPWGAFRAFSFNGRRTSLDPAPRWLPRPSVVDGRLAVADSTGEVTIVGEESRRAVEVGVLVSENEPASERLAELGIGWVVVERDTPGDVPVNLFVGLIPVSRSASLELWRVPGAAPGPGWGRGTVPVVVVDLAVVGLLLGASLSLIRSTPRRRLLPSGDASR